MAEHAGVLRRREAPRLITGAGAFVDDLRVPGCLHAAMLRTPHAHARIRAIDVAAARRAPGVVGVFVAGGLSAGGGPTAISTPPPPPPRPRQMRPPPADPAPLLCAGGAGGGARPLPPP